MSRPPLPDLDDVGHLLDGAIDDVFGDADVFGQRLNGLGPPRFRDARIEAAGQGVSDADPGDVARWVLQPVVRVMVYPDTPNSVVASSVRGTSSVEHVVLTSKDKKQVVQPLSKEPFTEGVQNGFGAKLQYTGVIATFALSDVRELRGGKSDQDRGEA